MNKSSIQKFAMRAREELITQVSQRAYEYGITKEGYGQENAVAIGGRALTSEEVKQRNELVAQIQKRDTPRSWKRLPTHGSTALLLCVLWKLITICPAISAFSQTAPASLSRKS